jgi:Cu(I)/Ag(I) efflux system membrane fusion protein
VLEGLAEGERVVLAGAMLLDSQAQLENLAPASGSNAVLLVPPPQVASHSVGLPKDEFLAAVVAVQTALAADDLVAANAALKGVPARSPAGIRFPAPEPAEDLARLRQAFLPWSVDVARAVLELGPRPQGLRVFRCTMTGRLWKGAPTRAEWIQFDAAPRNPFWGSAMPDCGVEVTR